MSANTILIGLVFASAPSPEEAALTQRSCERVLDLLVHGPTLPLHLVEDDHEAQTEDEASTEPCGPRALTELRRAMGQSRKSTPRAVLKAQGPEGSGRYWQVSLLVLEEDGRSRSACFQTSTRGFLHTLGRAEKRLPGGAVPRLADLGGDGVRELVLWSSLETEDFGAELGSECTAPPQILLPRVLRLEAGNWVPAPERGRELLEDVAAIYASLREKQAKDCEGRDDRDAVLAGVIRAMQAAGVGQGCAASASVSP